MITLIPYTLKTPTYITYFKEGSSIKINPNNRGKFTKKANSAGKSVLEFASYVLAHKDSFNSSTIKQANFARNAAKWQLGGLVPKSPLEDVLTPDAKDIPGIIYPLSYLWKLGKTKLINRNIANNIIQHSKGKLELRKPLAKPIRIPTPKIFTFAEFLLAPLELGDAMTPKQLTNMLMKKYGMKSLPDYFRESQYNEKSRNLN